MILARHTQNIRGRLTKEIYQLKCLIEDIYQKLPTFVGEEEWEKERVAELLKRK